MPVFLTGDTHNTYDIDKLLTFDEEGLSRDDYMIILGDFGFVWYPETEYFPNSPKPHEGRESDEDWLDWFEARPYTTLWIDGNHENFDLIEQYPVAMWHGGRAQFIRDHVVHLMRGEVYDIDGRTFFCMGGASSVDRKRRKPHESWWPQEVPGPEERAHALEVLEGCGWKVDYVLTHEAPTASMREIDPDPPYILVPDEFAQWLQGVADRLEFKRWFHGHHHVDRWWDRTWTSLYNIVFDLDDTGRTPYGPSTDLFDIDW